MRPHVLCKFRALKAQPFDLNSFHFLGPPIVIAQNEVEFWERAWFHCGFSVSESVRAGTGVDRFIGERAWAHPPAWLLEAGNFP
jgi:hypothetical protein